MQEHIDRIVAVFGDVRRVLRDDGTLWFNYGDAYAGSWGAQGRGDKRSEMESGGRIDGYRRKTLSDQQIAAHPKRSQTGSMKRVPGLKPKDLMLLPERLALALQADGWFVRSRIIWVKPNPMPESVTDRPTKSHEHIWLMSKSARYFYDANAIREHAEYVGPNSPGTQASPYGQGFTRRAKESDPKARPPRSAPHTGLSKIGAKGNANGFRGGSYVGGNPGQRSEIGNVANEDLSRNARDVWTIATVPFKDAHFATFPPQLAERCIKAGCPVGGVVLDPFGGAGTTGLVADRLQRDAILIELNPEYAAMAEHRIKGDRGGLLDLMESA
jgi:DNA modification methylase